MPFGIPSEDFHGGFGLPHDDDYDPYTGKYAFVSPDDENLTDEEYDALSEEVHDNTVRALIEASGEIREAKELLARLLNMLYLYGYDEFHGSDRVKKNIIDTKEFLARGDDLSDLIMELK